ncbi:MAG: alpha/beta fold hydrolase [Spirulinaceae cyanobacterium]
MSSSPTILWLSANPSFERFAQPLLRYVSSSTPLKTWQYQQHADEGSSLYMALELLHNYMRQCDRPVHLVGHSTGGLLGWLYARQYPEKVETLTLLGVGAYPAVDWQAHYYALQALLPCPRQMLLAQMVRMLFGQQNHYTTKALVEVLEKDIATSPSPHFLYQRCWSAAVKMTRSRISLPSKAGTIGLNPKMGCGLAPKAIISFIIFTPGWWAIACCGFGGDRIRAGVRHNH